VGQPEVRFLLAVALLLALVALSSRRKERP
jgi:hypothetical protein